MLNFSKEQARFETGIKTCGTKLREAGVSIIVRIEFYPVVEIGVSKGHYSPQETTNAGPTLINAWACYNLYMDRCWELGLGE